MSTPPRRPSGSAAPAAASRPLATGPESWWAKVARWWDAPAPVGTTEAAPPAAREPRPESVFERAANRGAPTNPFVEVVTDAATVREARESYVPAIEEALRLALAEPAGVQPHDLDSLFPFRAARPAAIAACRRVAEAAGETPERRVHAWRILRVLGEPVPVGELVAQAARSVDAARVLFDASIVFVPEGEPPPAAWRDFVLAALRSPEAELQGAAWREAEWRRIAEATPVLVAQFSDGERDPALLAALAALAPSAEVLEALRDDLRWLGVTEHRMGVAPVLGLAEATSDPALRRAAVEALREHLAGQRDDADLAPEASEAVDWLARRPETALAVESLAFLAREARWRRLRERALGRLARLDPEAAAEISTETETSVASADELAGPGGDAPTASAEELAETRARIAAVARAMVTRGLLPAAAEATAVARCTEEACGSLSDGMIAAWLLELGGRGVALPRESVGGRARHDATLLDLAEASGGRFRPEAIREELEPPAFAKDRGRRCVEFVHGDRLYRGHVARRGERLDHVVLFALVNGALADAGVPERFVPEADAEEPTTAYFGDPATLREFGIPSERRPDEE